MRIALPIDGVARPASSQTPEIEAKRSPAFPIHFVHDEIGGNREDLIRLSKKNARFHAIRTKSVAKTDIRARMRKNTGGVRQARSCQ